MWSGKMETFTKEQIDTMQDALKLYVRVINMKVGDKIIMTYENLQMEIEKTRQEFRR